MMENADPNWKQIPPEDRFPDGSIYLCGDTRWKFIQRVAALPIKPAARDYYVRWAESWTKARGHQSPERTHEYFDALGRSARLADWQFRQAVDAARVLACDVLTIPWASSFDWQGLSDQARSLEPDHRTLARESIRVRANLPPSPTPTPEQVADAESELKRLIESLRRIIRIKNMAMAIRSRRIYSNPAPISAPSKVSWGMPVSKQR